MRPSTIAHVLTSLSVGGSERVALLLANEQIRRGHSVIAVSLEEPRGGPLAREFAAIGAQVARVPKRPGFDATLSLRLYQLFRRLEIDLVHSHNPLPLVYAAPAARLARARAVHTKHGPHPDRPRRLWLRRIAAMSTHAFVAVSAPTAAYARSIREVSERKLHVIVNGVDLDQFALPDAARARARARWQLPHDAWVIGTVGRMAAVKDHPTLLRATAPLLAPRTRLVIAGDGPEAQATRALAHELGVAPWVHFTGVCDEVPLLLQALDLFVLSSRVEGMPLVLLEAMAAGLPIVATAVGGVPETVDDVARLVPPGDEHALRAAIQELGQNRHGGVELGRRGRERAYSHHSVTRMASRYLQIYAGGAADTA
jgi:glycosyltransferase involved in cell wall biosynthesis